MNHEDAQDWIEEILIEIFQSLSEHPPLHSMLVFKGARVLNEHLQEVGRRSLDIDSNMLQSFIESIPDRAIRQESLEKEMGIAISHHFETQSPVKYSLDRIRIVPQPPAEHPRGWDGYDVRLTVVDHTRPAVRGLPALTLDIAAPEELRSDSIVPLRVGTATVLAHTLERIAGEKLRAFLSSLPHYRAKVKKPGEAVRVKDIFDITRISHARPLDDRLFWLEVGAEFKLTCASRFIDCLGLESFEQNLPTTQSSYENDATLPNEIDFNEAWETIQGIVEFLEANDFIPFEFPLE